MQKEEDLMLAKKFIGNVKRQLNVCDKYVELDLNLLVVEEPKLYELFVNNPLEIKILLKEAIESFTLEEKELRLSNLLKCTKINTIRTKKDMGKFVSIKGIIKRTTKVIPRTIEIKYECSSCGTIVSIPQTQKKQKVPFRCSSCKRSNLFKMVSEEIIDIQEINLEETPEELKGEQPQQIRVLLSGELVDGNFSGRLQPGRRIEVMGIIQKLPPFMTQKDENLNLSEFMIDANNLISTDEEEEMEITEEDIEKIKEISIDNPLGKLSLSLATEVYGNEIVKKAIILQAVKGVPKKRTSGGLTRADIHILLCGDPGVAKSVMLQATLSKTPKARIVVGTKTSRVGIGAMVFKDELTNSWALESGALPLANGSTLMIDEIDKMHKENLSELLEPMSLGTISVNKAGISAVLPAKTSILASGNPIQGSFDLEQPISKQLDIPSPILNRFDLIFILLDRRDEEFDTDSLKHVLESQKPREEPEIDIKLFKKYITYCRKLTPSFGEDLHEEMINFYRKVRMMSSSEDNKGLPINLRNMEGIIRLSEAHAKIRLSEAVEKEDLKVAMEIFMHCLKQVGLDSETGLIDTSRVTEKVPKSKRGKLEKLLDIIESLSRETPEVPYLELLEEAEKAEIKKWEVSTFLEQLKKESQIFEPKRGYFSLQ